MHSTAGRLRAPQSDALPERDEFDSRLIHDCRGLDTMEIPNQAQHGSGFQIAAAIYTIQRRSRPLLQLFRTIVLLNHVARWNDEADIARYRALVEYALAIKAVQFEKGSLLDYN